MGWLIALAILTAISWIPVGVRTVYDESGVEIRVLVGVFQIPVFPGSHREKKEKTEKIKEPVKRTGDSRKQSSKKGGSLTDFLPLVRLAVSFLGDFRRKLRIEILNIRLVMAGGDPCDLAVNYGKAWAVMGNVLPQLDRVFVIRKRDLRVACDFEAEKTLIKVHAKLTITVGRILELVAVYGTRALLEYLKIMNKRKGGAENEPKSSQYASANHCKNP